METATFSFHADYDSLIQTGYQLIRQKHFIEALRIFQEACQLKSGCTQALIGSMSCYINLQRNADAVEVIHEILKIDPNCFQARYTFAHIKLISGRFEHAKSIIDGLLKDFPDDENVLSLQQKYFLDNYLYDEVEEVTLKLLKMKENSGNYNNLGLVNLERGDFTNAMALFQKGFKLFLQTPPTVPNKDQVFVDQNAAKYTLLKIKTTLDDLKIPFMIVAGTLLGIYRDGNILPHDKDIDLALPWKTPRLELIETLKSYGFISSYKKEQIVGNKGKWNISVYHIQDNVTIDFFFAKPEENSWVVGLEKNNKLLLQRSIIKGTSTIQYEQQSFNTVGNIEGYLEEVYGKNWRLPQANYNTLLLGERIIDTDGVGIILGYNHCLGALCNGNFKKAHGYCLQLLSIHEDPLLEQVKQYLEKHITDQQWYSPIPYRSNRTNNQQLFQYQ